MDTEGNHIIGDLIITPDGSYISPDGGVTIEKNVSASSLNATTEDSGYIDEYGNSVNRIHYKYTWNLGDEDLTSIQ